VPVYLTQTVEEGEQSIVSLYPPTRGILSLFLNQGDNHRIFPPTTGDLHCRGEVGYCAGVSDPNCRRRRTEHSVPVPSYMRNFISFP
jgi:hypothetical protein